MTNHDSTTVNLPAEVLFHRYFQRSQRLLREGYRGKADLDRLQPQLLPVSLLESLQQMLNTALQNENRNIPEHVDHDPFHLDYVDSDEPNALAFCSDNYSFIGVTIPLVERLWQASVHLSESAAIFAAFDVQVTESEREAMSVAQRIQVGAFRLQLFFVVLHEFTHVVHGHIAQVASAHGFSSEILIRGRGSLEHQAREADADGYAVYFILASIIDSPHERAHLLGVLGQAQKAPEAQDQVLLAAFIVAVGTFFFMRTPQELTADTAYHFTHPPQAARMNLVMKAVRAWCAQNRPPLVEWMTLARFQDLMRAVASVIRGMNGDQDWSDQVRFLMSAVGAEYYRKLDDALIQEVNAFGRRGHPGGTPHA
jgi:hypothetical protein